MTPEPIAWVEALKALGAGLSSIFLGLLLVATAPVVFATFIDQLGGHRVRARSGSDPRRHPYR
jgi:hypothetical protein